MVFSWQERKPARPNHPLVSVTLRDRTSDMQGIVRLLFWAEFWTLILMILHQELKLRCFFSLCRVCVYMIFSCVCGIWTCVRGQRSTWDTVQFTVSNTGSLTSLGLSFLLSVSISPALKLQAHSTVDAGIQAVSPVWTASTLLTESSSSFVL